MGTFQVNYNAGGTVDEVKKIKLLEQVDNTSNVEVVEEVKNLKNIELVQKVDDVGLVDKVGEVGNIDTVGDVNNVQEVQNVSEVSNVSVVGEVSKVKGFASFTQPFNTMKMFEVPASAKDPITGNDYEFEFELPNEPIEILAITMTCSGYGETDHYDLFFNDIKWFEDWYCSEVKEGLFLGTSTYVYEAVPGSKIKLIFKNDSGTQKKLWLGVRMLRN